MCHVADNTLFEVLRKKHLTLICEYSTMPIMNEVKTLIRSLIVETRTREYKVYKFAELSEDSKETAIEKFREFNLMYDWWDCVFEDAKNVGITIEEFDTGRGAYCKGTIYDIEETAAKIITEHGNTCDTHQTAAEYIRERAELVKKHSDGVNTDIVAEDNEYDFDNDCGELDAEFTKSIFEDYRILLQKECEYLNSDEAIIETIEANDYYFTKDGSID